MWLLGIGEPQFGHEAAFILPLWIVKVSSLCVWFPAHNAVVGGHPRTDTDPTREQLFANAYLFLDKHLRFIPVWREMQDSSLFSHSPGFSLMFVFSPASICCCSSFLESRAHHAKAREGRRGWGNEFGWSSANFSTLIRFVSVFPVASRPARCVHGDVFHINMPSTLHVWTFALFDSSQPACRCLLSHLLARGGNEKVHNRTAPAEPPDSFIGTYRARKRGLGKGCVLCLPPFPCYILHIRSTSRVISDEEVEKTQMTYN